MVTTRKYRNTSKAKVNILGVGELAAGAEVSVTADYHQPVNLTNYPGVIEVTDEEVAPKVSKK